MIGYGDVESVLFCQCNRTITSNLISPFNCTSFQGQSSFCATRDKNICFATRTEKGCISRYQCLLYDDIGYEVRKTFMKCCSTNNCNSDIDQNTIDDFSEGKPKY